MNKITIVSDKRLPRVRCPACTAELEFDIMPFRYDPNQIVKGQCPACNRELWTCLLIVSSIRPHELETMVQAMIKASGVVGKRLLRGGA